MSYIIHRGGRVLMDAEVLAWCSDPEDAEVFDTYEDATRVTAKLIACGGMDPTLWVEEVRP